MKQFVVFLGILGIILGAVTFLYAHDMWVEKKGQDLAIIYGHGTKIDPYDPQRVKEVKAFDVDGNEFAPEVKRLTDGAVIVSTGKEAIITVLLDNGYWVKTVDGWKNVSKREVKEYLESGHSLKFGKAIFDNSNRITKPLGLMLEIVPTENPLSVKIGEEMRIKVLYDDKPLEGAVIEAGGDHKETAKTDKNGTTNIIIKNSGKQIITARHKIPLKDDLDGDVRWLATSLFFEIK